MKLCGYDVGLEHRFLLIAGPCVIESGQLQMDVAGRLKEITASLGVPFIFKSSFDKANRSSGTSFRGLGREKGLEILAKVRRELGVPVLTDVHTEDDISAAAQVVDVLQTPAFLCRQTDFIHAAARSGRPVNIKKGQFLAPHDMRNVIAKARAAARDAGLSEDRFLACERGASFGYNNLVSDMRSLAVMRASGPPWCSTPRIRCNCPAPREAAAAASAQWSRCWPAPPSPRALPACSWKRTPTRTRPCRTAPTPFRSSTCGPCWRPWWRSTASPRRTASWKTTLRHENMSSGYIIASVTVTDPAQYEEYRKWSSLAMQAHGAEVCVRGGKVQVLEGDWDPGRTVVLKFPSVEAARAFYDSPEYRKARAARAGAAVMRMVCVEGL